MGGNGTLLHDILLWFHKKYLQEVELPEIPKRFVTEAKEKENSGLFSFCYMPVLLM